MLPQMAMLLPTGASLAGLEPEQVTVVGTHHGDYVLGRAQELAARV